MGKIDALARTRTRAVQRSAVEPGDDDSRATTFTRNSIGDLYLETVFNGPPGALSPVSVDAQTLGVNHAGGNVGADVTVDATPERETSAHAVAGRSTLGVSGETETVGEAFGGGVSMRRNYAIVDGHLKWAESDGTVAQVTGLGAFNRNEIVLGGFYSAGSGPLTPSVGGIVLSFFDRKVKDLGAVDDEGTRKVELCRTRKLGGIAYLGALAQHAGFGVRMLPIKGKEVVYRTHLRRDDARAFLFEKRGFTKDILRAAEVMSDKIEIPDPADLDALKVGDELILRTSGTLIGSFMAGGFGLVAGVQGELVGEFEIAVRRVSETELDLCITPTQVHAAQTSAHAPFVFDAIALKSKARSLRQAFRFDLSKPGAKETYLRALAGELPYGDRHASRAIKHAPDDEDALLRLVQAEGLPDGVKRTWVERIDAVLERRSASLSFGPFQAFMPHGIGGWGRARHKVDETSQLAAGERVLNTSTRGVEKRRELLLSGHENAGAFATLRRRTVFSPEGKKASSFDGLMLTLRFSDDRVHGLELNDEMLKPLRRAFDIDIRDYSVEGANHEQSVEAGFTLSAFDLDRLARSSPARVAQVAARTGASRRALQHAIDRLGDDSDPLARASVIQQFVRDVGIPGVGALFQLLDDPSRLTLSSTSSAYTKPAQEAAELALRFGAPVSVDEDKHALTARFEAARHVAQDAEAGLALLDDDPLAADKNEKAAMLRSALETVRALCSLEHLAPEDRTVLADRLGYGWLTSLLHRIRDRLRGRPAHGPLLES